jgi:hypothetical protein
MEFPSPTLASAMDSFALVENEVGRHQWEHTGQGGENICPESDWLVQAFPSLRNNGECHALVSDGGVPLVFSIVPEDNSTSMNPSVCNQCRDTLALGTRIDVKSVITASQEERGERWCVYLQGTQHR